MSMEINEMQEMNERAKKALEYHKKGYNCSQAVACSFVRSLLRTSEHRSMYSYVRLSIDRCTATYV